MAKQSILHSGSLSLISTDRESVRREVVDAWLREEPGTEGTRHCYRYDVEQLADGAKIYLMRPTRLNKGMDFVIHCERFIQFKNGNSKPPRHLDLMSELLLILAAGGSDDAAVLRNLLYRVWSCDDPHAIFQASALAANVRVERVLKLARWFFVEQDLTYWTESGRWMLRRSIENHLGPLA